VLSSSKTYPIVWAESLKVNGSFVLSSEKKNHKRYFRFRRGDEWLITTTTCILLQRTTAKEQEKRLIAAVLPSNILKKHKGVAVENHINMIIPIHAAPAIDIGTLNFFLNSKAANNAFRSMSGSVAISAYELESFPLPDPDQLQILKIAIQRNVSNDEKEAACLQIYTKHR
jgi:adenine-specific DNA-methyltransferase